MSQPEAAGFAFPRCWFKYIVVGVAIPRHPVSSSVLLLRHACFFVDGAIPYFCLPP